MKVCPTCNRLFPTSAVVCPKDGALLNTLREWQSGDTVAGKYTIIEKLGHGSLGPAFRAKAFPAGGTRILKCLPVRLVDDEGLLRDFQREIESVSALQHPNVVRLESLERAMDGRWFIVMDYGPGFSLRELLTRGGYIPARDVVGIMGQVCAAMASAHSAGIIHRNLKPDNILIAEGSAGTPHVKVLELGMAKLRQLAAEGGKHVGDVIVTDRSVVVGTMEYMSPEQSIGALASTVDGRSDLYSVGVIMFEALTGELPIATEDPVGLLRQKQEGAANELLCSTVLRALQSDPELRFQTASDMQTALLRVSHSLGRASEVAVAADLQVRASSVKVTNKPSRQEAEAEGRPALPPSGGEVPPPASPHRDPLAPPKLTPRAPSNISNEDFDDIRKTWDGEPRGRSAKNRTSRRLVHVGTILVGIALAGSLAWLQVHREATPDPVPQGESRPGVTTEAKPPAPATLPDSGTRGVQPPVVVSSSGDNQPNTGKTVTESGQVGQSAEARPSPAQTAAGGPRPVSNTAATPVTTPKAAARSVADMAPAEREAELKKQIAAGWSQMERGETAAAIDSFTFALQIDPSNAEAKAALRLARFASQHPDQSVLPSSAPAGGNGNGEGQP